MDQLVIVEFDFLDFFFIFSCLTILLVLVICPLIIITQNTIHALLFLICVFFILALNIITLKADYLSYIILIIYIGAIAVLFLFCIMMINITFSLQKDIFLKNVKNFFFYSFFFIFYFIILSFFLRFIFDFSFFQNNFLHFIFQNISFEKSFIVNNNMVSEGDNSNYEYDKSSLLLFFSFMGSCRVLGIMHMGDFLYTFGFSWIIISGIILLVPMIGAIILTLHKNRYGLRRQYFYEQYSRNYNLCIKLN